MTTIGDVLPSVGDLHGEIRESLRLALRQELEAVGVMLGWDEVERLMERLSHRVARGVLLVEVDPRRKPSRPPASRGPRLSLELVRIAEESREQINTWARGLDAAEFNFSVSHDLIGKPHAEVRRRFFEHVSAQCYVCNPSTPVVLPKE